MKKTSSPTKTTKKRTDSVVIKKSNLVGLSPSKIKKTTSPTKTAKKANLTTN